jgi:hypothetical protein
MSHVEVLARRLPAQRYLVNLCEKRYHFILAFCAALVRGQTNLLPASRVQAVVDETLASHAGSYCCDDELVRAAIAGGAAGKIDGIRSDSAPAKDDAAGNDGAPGSDQAPGRHEGARSRIHRCESPDRRSR